MVVYPEPEAPLYYHRGKEYYSHMHYEEHEGSTSSSSSNSGNDHDQYNGNLNVNGRLGGKGRFLNSGCVAGRAGDVKRFIQV